MEPMNRRSWGRLTAGLIGVPLLGGVTACGGSSSDGDANVRLVNASAGYPSLDFYVGGTLYASSVAYGTKSDYIGVDAGSYTTAFMAAGSTTAVLSQTHSLAEDAPTTLVAYGWNGSLKAFALTDTESAPASGYTKVMVYNTAADAGSVNVYLGGEGSDVANATAVAYSVAANSNASYVRVAAGSYRLRVTTSTDTTSVLLDTTGLTLTSEKVLCLVVTPGSGGVLVNALSIVQGGAVTSFVNPNARLRLVSAVTGGAVASASFNGTTLASSATAPSVGAYVNVGAATAVPTVSVAGTAVTLPALTLSAGGDYTLLLWGDATAPQYTLVSDDNRLPSSTTATKMRLINGLETDAALTLSADYSSVVDNLARGQASSYVTLAKTSLNDLQVSSGGTVLYENSDGVTLIAEGVYTVFMFGTATPTGRQFMLRKER
jgi:Domain of unknown function (DUF4397)